MTHICLPDERLAEVRTRPREDTLRREAERCASCRSRLQAFQEFLHPTNQPDGADPDQADARLATIMDAEIFGVTGHTAALPGASRGRFLGREPLARKRGGVFGWFWIPALRPVWGAAVVILAVWGVRSAGLLEPSGGDVITLRDAGSPAGVPAAAALAVSEPVAEPGGGFLLRWGAVAGADRYEVIVLDAAFEEKMRSDAGAETSLVLAKEPAVDLRASGEALFWRVVAYRGGDVIARAQIASLNLGHARPDPGNAP